MSVYTMVVNTLDIPSSFRNGDHAIVMGLEQLRYAQAHVSNRDDSNGDRAHVELRCCICLTEVSSVGL